MSSKLSIINGAYSKLRINGLTINPTPELITVALEVLEDMMAFYKGKAILLGYNFEETPDVNTDTGVIHDHNLMMKSNLAVNLIPDFGKEVPEKLRTMADMTLSAAVGASAYAVLDEVQYPNRMPLGSGNTLRNNQQHKFYRSYKANPIDSTANQMVAGDIQDYAESFHAYLLGEKIKSFVITNTDGLKILNKSSNDEVILYRVEAQKTSVKAQSVNIVMTTETGRIESRDIKFDLRDIK